MASPRIEWMNAAQTIVVMAGHTQWIDWELRNAISGGHVGKLLVIFPEPKGQQRSLHDHVQRLKTVGLAFQDTIWHSSLAADAHDEEIRSIAFSEAGDALKVTSRSSSRNASHLAALVGTYQLRLQNNLPLNAEERSPLFVAARLLVTVLVVGYAVALLYVAP